MIRALFVAVLLLVALPTGAAPHTADSVKQVCDYWGETYGRLAELRDGGAKRADLVAAVDRAEKAGRLTPDFALALRSAIEYVFAFPKLTPGSVRQRVVAECTADLTSTSI